MNDLSAFVATSDIGIVGGYIYLVFSEEPAAAYVGQTRGHLGALGRLSQHLSATESNTFLKRIGQRHSLSDIKVSRIHFFAYRLPDEKRFQERYSDYREAVEGATVKFLLNLFHEHKISVPLVSNFQLNGYSAQFDILKLASTIAAYFFEKIRGARCY